MHNRLFAEYIEQKMRASNLNLAQLSEISNISKGELSKILSMTRSKISPLSFYKAYKAFGDSFSTIKNFVFPDIKLKNDIADFKNRNEFGVFMKKFEKDVKTNTPIEISASTGINITRIKAIYVKKGAVNAEELILIEMAIGKNPGELFELYYG